MLPERLKPDNLPKLEAGSFNLINLLKLTPEQEKALRERIINQGGYIDILVHPFHNETKPVSDRGPSPKYIHDRDEFIKESIITEKPLVIFEEQLKIPQLRRKIKEARRGTLYIVATDKEKPTPVLPGKEMLTNHLTKEEVEEAWNQFGEILKRLGVKRVNVGGRYLYFANTDYDHVEERQTFLDLKELAKDKPYANEWLSDHILPYGCAGVTAQNLLKQGLDVSLSRISSPDSIEP